jgi:putative FmdB family regulatory protein
MPIYEYICPKCKNKFEKLQKIGSFKTQLCPKCGKKVDTILSPAGLQFKGSGWYCTDYAGK